MSVETNRSDIGVVKSSKRMKPSKSIERENHETTGSRVFLFERGCRDFGGWRRQREGETDEAAEPQC